ncbi:hypothetical protein JL720_5207 [Aureococcus anophagefferens]|nr:hypothetical protein JL720_5207 [Aureococcus anophagefferens]
MRRYCAAAALLLVATRACPDVSFTARNIAVVGSGESVLAIDVDDDGDIDVLAASKNDDTVNWYENDGSQSFTERIITTLADEVRSTYAIDVDGDGDDALSASLADDTVAWYENDGSQSFTTRVVEAAADAAVSVFAIDVDGDGDVDALSASKQDDTVAWYDNDGSESFTERVITTLADGAYSVYAIDVDGDADVDALSAINEHDEVAWSFTERVITTLAVEAQSVFAVDVDDDGDVGVSASAGDDTIAWYVNDGVGVVSKNVVSTLAVEALGVYAIDVDGDGDVDVLSASANDDTVAWYENDGSQSFTERVVTSLAVKAVSVFAFDVDGDGDVDALSAGEAISWYENDCEPFEPPPQTTCASVSFLERVVSTLANNVFSVFAADVDGGAGTMFATRTVYAIDVDGDGDVDALSASYSQDTVAWFENDGSQSFTERVVAPSADGARVVFAIDVDGDGDVDVLSGTQEAGSDDNDDTVAWYENDGSESFTERVIIDTLHDVQSVFAIDVNGDGAVDALSASSGDNTVAYYENVGSLFFLHRVITVAFSEHDITVNADGAACTFAIDVDGDGDVDAMSASYRDDTVAWYENDGSQSFTERVITTLANAAISVYAIDVDGDGDVDALSASVNDNTSFTERVISNSADVARSVFAIDVDGDGDVDALSASYYDDTVAWYENDGSQSFTERVITTLADEAFSVFAIDVDGDGNVDALSASANDDMVAWYENDGSQSFTEHIITDSANGAYSVFALDVDGDGDVDVLSASQWDETVAWYENDGSQFFTQRIITNSADGARSVFAIDFDGDGDVDALSASSQDDTIAWRVVVDLPPGESPLYFLPGDVNGDKDVDVGYSKLDADGSYVFALRSTCDAVSGRGPGGRIRVDEPKPRLASDLGNIVLENLDGDGDYDVVTSWGDSDGFGVTVLLDEGDDVVDAAATDVARVAAVDVDGDADLDVVAASAAGLVWYENDGDSIYGCYSYNNNYYCGTRRTPINATAIADAPIGQVFFEDLDGDGDLEILVADFGNGQILALEEVCAEAPDPTFDPTAAPSADQRPRRRRRAVVAAPSPPPTSPPTAPFVAIDAIGELLLRRGARVRRALDVPGRRRDLRKAPHPEPSSPSPSGAPSAAPSPAPSPAPSTAAPSSFPTPDCSGNASLFSYERGPDVESWAGSTTTSYAGLDGTNGAVLRTLDDADTTLVTFLCAPDDVEVCNTVVFDFGDAVPSGDLFFRVTLGNSSIETSFDDEESPVSTYMFCLSHGAIVRAPAAAPTASPAPTTGSPSDAPSSTSSAMPPGRHRRFPARLLQHFRAAGECAQRDAAECSQRDTLAEPSAFALAGARARADDGRPVQNADASSDDLRHDDAAWYKRDAPSALRLGRRLFRGPLRARRAVGTATGSPAIPRAAARSSAPTSASRTGAPRELRLLRAAVGRAERPRRRRFLEITSVGAEQVCVGNLECPILWTYRGPDCATASVVVVSSADGAVVSSAAGVDNFGRGGGVVPGDAALSDYEMTIAACGVSGTATLTVSATPAPTLNPTTLSPSTSAPTSPDDAAPIFINANSPTDAAANDASADVVPADERGPVPSAGDRRHHRVSLVFGDLGAAFNAERPPRRPSASRSSRRWPSSNPRTRCRTSSRRAPGGGGSTRAPPRGCRTASTVVVEASDVDAATADVLATYEADLSDALEDGSYAEALDDAADAEGTDFSFDVDEASSVASVEASEVDKVIIGTPAPTLSFAPSAARPPPSGAPTLEPSPRPTTAEPTAAPSTAAGDRAADRRPDGPADGDLRPHGRPDAHALRARRRARPARPRGRGVRPGARLTLTFDAPTDLAGLDAGALFACGDLFDFPGAADASCYWYNATAADATVDAVVPATPRRCGRAS